MGVAVVTVSYNTIGLTALLLWSLHRVLASPPAQIVVVDNGSSDGSAELLRDLDGAGVCSVLANDRNEHHGPAINRAMAWLAAQPRPPAHIWVLDSDVVIGRGDAMTAAGRVAEETGAALVGEPMWDRWHHVERLELYSLFVDPAQVWVEGIGPFDDSGDPAWPVLEGARRAGLVTAPLAFAADGYVIHRGRSTLAVVAERNESDNPLYDWALDHHAPHFGGVDGAPERYAALERRFRAEVPTLTSAALARACGASS
jgi:glycosyltransferase involved in cell wall biosynthesis